MKITEKNKFARDYLIMKFGEHASRITYVDDEIEVLEAVIAEHVNLYDPRTYFFYEAYINKRDYDINRSKFSFEFDHVLTRYMIEYNRKYYVVDRTLNNIDHIRLFCEILYALERYEHDDEKFYKKMNELLKNFGWAEVDNEEAYCGYDVA